MCPHCIHLTSLCSYQSLCSLVINWPDPLSPAAEHCCEFLCKTFFFFFPPCFLKIMFATSSDCHSYSSDHRDLTTAFLFLLPRLSPTICHIFYVTESLAYPTICPALFSLLGRTPRGQRLSSALACSRTGC